MDPLWSRVSLPIESHAEAMGMGLRLRTNAQRIAELFDSAFGATEGASSDRPRRRSQK